MIIRGVIAAFLYGCLGPWPAVLYLMWTIGNTLFLNARVQKSARVWRKNHGWS